MNNAAHLRSEAARCRRLASGVGNRDLAAKLAALADEFETAADECELAEKDPDRVQA